MKKFQTSRSQHAGATLLFALVLSSVLIACDGTTGSEIEPTSQASATSVASASLATASTSSFTATMTGDHDMHLEGEEVLAGVMYKRYHINMASKESQNTLPVVVIAFGNIDTTTPAPGIYPLAGKEGFRGSVEIYSNPQQDFQITGGELTITEAKGDVLAGSFKLKAKEQPEEYGAPSAEIEVEGKFISRAAGK